MQQSLVDRFGRKIDYLRISVTDRCDLRCSYCLPQGCKDYLEPENWLGFAEIERMVAAFARLGVSKIRLTGGEPLLRRDLPKLAAAISAIEGIDDLSLSTNGTLLEKYAAELKTAGIHRINLSLDSLAADKLAKITGRDVLQKIIKGIDSALISGFHLRINMVLIPGVNADEIEDMVQFCREKRIILRFIEPMPMGENARSIGAFDLQPVITMLTEKFGLLPVLLPGGGPARYLQSADGACKIGFITPLSQHFCESCNRVRMSADGDLHLCLGQENRVAFRELLRGGITDSELEQRIVNAVMSKPERHDFVQAPQKINRFMSATGG